MIACGESDWQYSPQPRRDRPRESDDGSQHWIPAWRYRKYENNDESDCRIKIPMGLFYSKWFQHVLCLLRPHLRTVGSSCYFSFFFSHSLIPLTSRLRINYISIDWPLEGGIDIHGPPSAPRPMCIPQYRAPAFCITPGLHYLLYSLWSQVFPSEPGLPASPHPHLRTGCAKNAQESSTAQNWSDWNVSFWYKCDLWVLQIISFSGRFENRAAVARRKQMLGF